MVSVQVGGDVYFYPRSPCGERLCLYRLSLITLPISIHALLAESDLNLPSSPIDKNISIHALLAESDGGCGVGNWPRVIFLSTLSLRRATDLKYKRDQTILFLSTLSLRRATILFSFQTNNRFNFYPRSPCGERPKHPKSISCKLNFYPRSPCGERPERKS